MALFTLHEQQRYKVGTIGRLKDKFVGSTVRVRGAEKVMSHFKFGLLVLTTYS